MVTIVVHSTDLITLQEAARLLGVSRPLLYYWGQTGRIHLLCLSSRRYALRREIEALVRQRNFTGG